MVKFSHFVHWSSLVWLPCTRFLSCGVTTFKKKKHAPFYRVLCTYQCQAGGVGGGVGGIGRDFDRSLWPGDRTFELSCCPGGKDIWIFVRARDHKSFPGLRISVTGIFDLTFLPRGREFDSNFLENVKIPPNHWWICYHFWNAIVNHSAYDLIKYP